MKSGFAKTFLYIFTAGFCLLSIKLTILHFADKSSEGAELAEAEPILLEPQSFGLDSPYRLKTVSAR